MDKQRSDIDEVAERAYRRGVHQALAMLGYFLDETGRPVGEVLPAAVKMASEIRSSDQPAPFLLDRLFERLGKQR